MYRNAVKRTNKCEANYKTHLQTDQENEAHEKFLDCTMVSV